MHKTYLSHTLILLSLFIPNFLLAASRLTVVVVIDGLRQENLNLMRPFWPQGGLRTCTDEAASTTITYPHWVFGGDETTASFVTGTTPLYNGYTMDATFSRRERKSYPILTDNTQEGIGTSLQLSPRNLIGTTITDKLRISQGENAKIYAVGIHPYTTIVLAGHAANACCWLNADKMLWATTSFYPEGLPSAADQMNISERIKELSSKPWTPRMDVSMYSHPTDEEKKNGFSYASNKVLTQSPAANTLVVELALAIQKEKHLGEDDTRDMLLLELNALSPNALSDKIMSAEQEDLYLNINQDLGYLMEQLIKRIGREHLDVLVVGKPVLGVSAELMATANTPIRKFNIDKTAALTATYLMAIYGHERWIDGGYGHSIYLNRTLIEQKRLSLETLQRQVADFLMEFEGIQLAYPFREALLHEEIYSSVNKRNAGDVIFTLEPGWQLMESDWKPLDTVVDDETRVPLLFWSGSGEIWPKWPTLSTEIKDLLVP